MARESHRYRYLVYKSWSYKNKTVSQFLGITLIGYAMELPCLVSVQCILCLIIITYLSKLSTARVGMTKNMEDRKTKVHKI